MASDPGSDPARMPPEVIEAPAEAVQAPLEALPTPPVAAQAPTDIVPPPPGPEADAGLVEAILFLENEPLDEKTLVAITGLPRERLETALRELRGIYEDPRHGIELTSIAGGHCFAPKPSHTATLQSRYGKKNENRLSRAALETLSIIAYSQPVTRAEIEGMRGVSAEGMVRLLTEHGLVKVVGKRDAPGKPVEYGTTREFLKLFRLSSISELPKLDEVDREKYASNE